MPDVASNEIKDLILNLLKFVYIINFYNIYILYIYYKIKLINIKKKGLRLKIWYKLSIESSILNRKSTKIITFNTLKI
jgi:hypothetical protein